MLRTFHTTDWFPWEERNTLPTEPGIYLIAKGQPGEIIYVGQTNGDGGLRKRLRAFHRSATTGLKGHAGGVTFNGVYGPTALDLFVSVHVPKIINPVADVMGVYLDYVERFFIWQAVEKTGKLPLCNRC